MLQLVQRRTTAYAGWDGEAHRRSRRIHREQLRRGVRGGAGRAVRARAFIDDLGRATARLSPRRRTRGAATPIWKRSSVFITSAVHCKRFVPGIAATPDWGKAPRAKRG